MRSIAKSEEVVKYILKNPKAFGKLFDGKKDGDPVVMARSVDAVEKISRKNNQLLQRYSQKIIYEIAPNTKQKELRWHIVQMYSYLEINSKEKEDIIKLLLESLDDPKEKSKIVKVFCMQSLSDLVNGIRPTV